MLEEITRGIDNLDDRIAWSRISLSLSLFSRNRSHLHHLPLSLPPSLSPTPKKKQKPKNQKTPKNHVPTNNRPPHLLLDPRTPHPGPRQHPNRLTLSLPHSSGLQKTRFDRRGISHAYESHFGAVDERFDGQVWHQEVDAGA